MDGPTEINFPRQSGAGKRQLKLSGGSSLDISQSFHYCQVRGLDAPSVCGAATFEPGGADDLPSAGAKIHCCARGRARSGAVVYPAVLPIMV